MGVDAHVSERTLREIYLRGFEIAVKEGAPTAIMSSYNLINGVHAANSKDLCTRIAREEWGFDGVIMSDWNTTVPEDGSIPWVCVAAGNDIIMPGNPDDDKNIRDAYKEGKLTEKEREMKKNYIRMWDYRIRNTLEFKREFSKLIGFLVVALVAVGLVFNASGVKDVLLQLFNKIIGA